MFRFIKRFTTPTNDAERIHLLQTRQRFCQRIRSTIYFRRRYTTTSNFIYKSPWNLPFKTVRRARRDSWTTNLRVFIRSLSAVPLLSGHDRAESGPRRTTFAVMGGSSSQFFLLSSSRVSDREERSHFWINGNRRARGNFFNRGSKMDDIDDGCLSLTRYFESVLFNPREI